MATAVRSQRISLGSGVTTGKWHHLMISYDENATDDYELKVYLDGALSGYTADLGGTLQVNSSNAWLLGTASMNAPTNGRFIGLLDDMRFYCSTNALKLAKETYNHGHCDLSLSVEASFPANTHSNPISANLTFKKYGIEHPLTDFNTSRLSVKNGILHATSGSGANWQIDFNSSVDPGRVTVSLLEGVGIDGYGQRSKPLSFTVGYARPLTRVEALTAWWSFDEGSGTTVTDYMNGFVGNFFSGDGGSSNVSFDSGNAKFGSALRFPTNAWVETNAFASNLGISGGNPRTLTFWVYAENGNNGNRGPYGLGQRSCPNSTHRMWGIRGFWDTNNYRRFRTQHWCWDPDVFVSEGMRDKWMHIAHTVSFTHLTLRTICSV